MAQRRMISIKVIDTDTFLDMPSTSRLLYYDLCLRADDDGFVANFKKIIRMTGAQEDDLRVLIGKGFVIPFETGVCVIKHWRIHNYIQKDRYQKTLYQEEFSKLQNLESGEYTRVDDDGYKMDTKWIQNTPEMYPKCIQSVNTMETQVRLGKARVVKANKSTPKDTSENKFPDNSPQVVLSKHLFSLIAKLDDKARYNPKWADDIDKMIRLDGRNESEVRALIDFAHGNEFWKKNILSAGKLREKATMLTAQMKGDKASGSDGKRFKPGDKTADTEYKVLPGWKTL